MKDYYLILQLSRTATMNDIRAAYKRFALQLHPDVTGGNEEKTVQFKQLTEAYNVLSNTDRRRQYDEALGVIPHHHHHDPHHHHGTYKNPHDVKAPHPPADFKVFDFDEWNAWHYGDNAYQQEPIIRRNRYMDIGKHETGAQYFIRRKTREVQSQTPYRSRESEREMIVNRMKKRRESREAGGSQRTPTAL